MGIVPYPLELSLNEKLFLWTDVWIQISRGKEHWQGNWFSTKTLKIEKKPWHNKLNSLRGKEKKRKKKPMENWKTNTLRKLLFSCNDESVV